jgi:hypothetical protein
MVGFKVPRTFTRLVGKDVQPLQRLAVLTVKSGLDPHMITELEDGLKSCSLVILAIFLWCIISLCLMWVGINLYFISNQVLIKFE